MAVHWGGRGRGHGSRWSDAAGTPASVPPPVINIMVSEGDSITAFDSYQAEFVAAYPGITYYRKAIGGSGIGTPSDTPDPSGLTLWCRLPTVLALNPDLVTVLIGANDLGSDAGLTNYFPSLYDYVAAIKAARPSCIVMLSTVLPSTQAGFSARRATVNAGLRADVGTDFDGLIPMGDHPDIGKDSDAADTAKYPDGLHPTGTGVFAKMGNVFRAAIGPVVDQATGSTPSAFTFTDVNNVDLGSTNTAETIVTGMGLNHTASAFCAGTGTIRRSYDTDGTGPITVRNGDIITSTVAASASYVTEVDHSLTIGGVSDTFAVTTKTAPGASADFVTDNYVSATDDQGFGGAPNSFPASSFPAGRPVVLLNTDRPGLFDHLTIDGATAKVVAQSGGFMLCVGPDELTAGDYDVLAYGSSQHLANIWTGALTGLSSNVETGSSILATVFRFDGLQQGSTSLTVGTGGVVVMWGLTDGGGTVDSITGGGEIVGTPGGTFWAKTTSSGNPGFTNSGSAGGASVTALVAASFDP